jgi:hypothetical protein
MVPVPAKLADFNASRILDSDRRDPAEPKIGGEFARSCEVVEHGDSVIPSADCLWIILISPHLFAERTMRLEVVNRKIISVKSESALNSL